MSKEEKFTLEEHQEAQRLSDRTDELMDNSKFLILALKCAETMEEQGKDFNITTRRMAMMIMASVVLFEEEGLIEIKVK